MPRDGRLVSVAHATPTGDFRKEDHGLYAVHLRLVERISSSSALPMIRPSSGRTWACTRSTTGRWTELVTGHRLEKVLECNWKVFWENYNECLHCPGIHPELSDMVPIYRKGIMSEQEAPDWTPEVAQAPVLKAGAQTWTMDGQPCGPEFPNLTAQERANGHNFVTLYPTMFIVAHVDYVRAVSLTPLGPERTRLTAEWLFPPRHAGAAGVRPGARDGFCHDRVAAGWGRLRDEPARAARRRATSTGG